MENLVLVTGGSGAVGSNCILHLLQQGYAVRTTLRSLAKKEQLLDLLKNAGAPAIEQLSFVQADLGSDENWTKAMDGCAYVLHVASPTYQGNVPESKIIGPAVDGVLRVLKAARDAGVKRVVLTSSFGALGFSHHDPKTETTEADWTDPNERGLSAYEKSKALSERAAWDFMKREGAGMELAVINPVAIFGPLLGPNQSPSFGLLNGLLSGKMKAIPNIQLNAVDISDVADLHVRAMINPEAAGQRFIATADGAISLPEIAQLLKNKMPAAASKVSSRILPDWIVRLGALFNAEARHGALFLKVNRRVSNAKARKILGWTPIANNEQTILAAAESMAKYGMIK